MSQLIAYGCREIPPAMECSPKPLPLKGLATLTEVMCFVIYNSAMTVEELGRELDDVLATGRDAVGSETMEALVLRVYEALADAVENGETRLYGVCFDQTADGGLPSISATAQRVEIPFPACGELIHDLCGNALLQRSAIADPHIEDVRTWQDVVMSARDAHVLVERIKVSCRGSGPAEAEPTLADAASESNHRGRRKGSGLYPDDKIVQEMDRLLRGADLGNGERRAVSPNDAATILLPCIFKRGEAMTSDESAKRRVRDKYKKAFGEAWKSYPR